MNVYPVNKWQLKTDNTVKPDRNMINWWNPHTSTFPAATCQDPEMKDLMAAIKWGRSLQKEIHPKNHENIYREQGINC